MQMLMWASLIGLGICGLVLISKLTIKNGPDYDDLFKAAGVCLVVLAFSFFMQTGESEQSSSNQNLTVNHKPETPHPGIAEGVTPLDSSVVVVDGIEVKIVGIDYGKDVDVQRNNGWQSSDDRGILDSAAGSFGEGLGRGLAQAITGQEDEEKHMDGELVIYFEMVNTNSRPRTPDIPIRIVDDKKTEYTIYDSMKSFGHGPMQPGEKYLESVWLKAYSDVQYFQVYIGENVFTINAPKFKNKEAKSAIKAHFLLGVE